MYQRTCPIATAGTVDDQPAGTAEPDVGVVNVGVDEDCDCTKYAVSAAMPTKPELPVGPVKEAPVGPELPVGPVGPAAAVGDQTKAELVADNELPNSLLTEKAK